MAQTPSTTVNRNNNPAVSGNYGSGEGADPNYVGYRSNYDPSNTTQYFSDDYFMYEFGYQFELRTGLAWNLIKGQSLLIGQNPQMVVNNAFYIADLFIQQAEARNGLKKIDMSLEDYHKLRGNMRKTEFAEFPSRGNQGDVNNSNVGTERVRKTA